MKKASNLIFALFLGLIAGNAQNYQWAKSMGGPSQDAANSIALDGSGNLYTIGIFTGTVDFDPGMGTSNLTSIGNSDIFISKLDSAGNFIWAKSIGGPSGDFGSSIALDRSGNVYATGNFIDTVDFDPGVGITNLISSGGRDIFISKLNSAGNFIWAKSMGGSSDDFGNSIVVDGTGNVHISGSFSDTVDFNPGVGITNLTSSGGRDIFISRLDSAGNFIWAKSMGGPSDDFSSSIALDGSGNIHTSGNFSDTVDFDPGTGTAYLTSSGGQDIFISKLDAAGNFIWAKSMGGNAIDISSSIAVDGSGNVHSTGFFSGIVDFDPGAGTTNLTSNGIWDIFISKLDAAGNFSWAKNMGGNTVDIGDDITVDSSGNVYTTGVFSGIVDFDPGAATNNLSSAGFDDIFISKLDAAGNFIWAKSIGGPADDFGYSIAVDGSGNVFTAGRFTGTADFDPGAGTRNLISAGNWDIFISKLGAVSVGILENNFENILNAYPNPTIGAINIELGGIYDDVTVSIRNVIGQAVFQQSYRNSKVIQLNITGRAGMYFIEVNAHDKVAILRVIKN